MFNENDSDMPLDDEMTAEEFAKRIADPLRKKEVVDSTFESRIMSAVRAERKAFATAPHAQRVSKQRRSSSWISASRIAVAVTLAAAAVFALVVIGSRDSQIQIVSPIGDGKSVFSLHAPGAQSVALVGAFNDWKKGATALAQSGSTGTWSVSLPLPPGRHEYAFIVSDADGERWVTDPAALSLRDEFGTESSVRLIEDRSDHSNSGTGS